MEKTPKACPTLNVTKEDLSSPEALGSKVMKNFTNISQQTFQNNMSGSTDRNTRDASTHNKGKKEKRNKKYTSQKKKRWLVI